MQSRKKLESIFKTELEKRKQEQENASETRSDLMDGLMQIKDENGDLLSDEEVADNIAGLIVAAYESSALVSMWAIYYLAKFPNVLQKLRVYIRRPLWSKIFFFLIFGWYDLIL